MNGSWTSVFPLNESLSLHHRHHDVAPGGPVVKVEGTAHMMDKDIIQSLVELGMSFVPATWMIIEGKAEPMEYDAIPKAGERWVIFVRTTLY